MTWSLGGKEFSSRMPALVDAWTCSSPGEGWDRMSVVMGGGWRASTQGRFGEPWVAG